MFVTGNGDDDIKYLESCNCISVAASEADFILARGNFAIHNTRYSDANQLMQDIQPHLQQCGARNLPLVVTNPDCLRPGGLTPMPGRFPGRLHSEMAPYARIHYIGKPHAQVYAECMSALSFGDAAASRVCCIGDSLEHDVQGATKMGFDSLWIMNGVHCEDLGTQEGSKELADEKLVAQLLSRHPDAHPTFAVSSFS